MNAKLLTSQEFELALFKVLDTHTEPFEHWKECKLVVLNAYQDALATIDAQNRRIAELESVLIMAFHGFRNHNCAEFVQPCYGCKVMSKIDSLQLHAAAEKEEEE